MGTIQRVINCNAMAASAARKSKILMFAQSTMVTKTFHLMSTVATLLVFQNGEKPTLRCDVQNRSRSVTELGGNLPRKASIGPGIQ
jgi:hypothetical protein